MSEQSPWHRHRPGGVLGAAALGAALATVGLVGSRSSIALLATGVGVVGLTVGLALEDRRAVGVGVVGVLGGVLAAGAVGTPTERLLPAAATALLGWVFGVGSLDRRAHLGGGAVERSELLHVAAATTVGGVATGGAYLVSQTVEVGVSTLGVALLMLAAVALAFVLRE